MRVDFLSPVQRVISSATMFGTNIAANIALSENEEQRDARARNESAEDRSRFERKMSMEQQKLEQKRERDVVYEKDVGVRARRAETEWAKAKESIAVSKQNRRIANQRMKEALMQAQADKQNAETAYKDLKRVDGVVDLGQFRKKEDK